MRFYISIFLVSQLVLSHACGPQGSHDVTKSTEPSSIKPHKNNNDLPKPEGFFDIPSNRLEDAFLHHSMYRLSPEFLKENYQIAQQLSAGLSGAKIFTVTRREEKDKSEYVLKVVNEYTGNQDLFKHIGFREIFFAKLLSEMQSTDFLPLGMKSSEFFPRFFGFGFIEERNLFASRNNSHKIFPCYIMEMIQGMTLVDFAKKPTDAKNLFGYNLSDAPRGAIFSVLFQLAIALVNADRTLGFRHLDLHPGNIILTTSPIDGEVFTYGGIKIALKGPKIKIVDFDQSELKQSRPTPRPHSGYRPLLGPQIELYKAENNLDTPEMTYLIKSFARSENFDIRAINFLFYTFKRRLQKEGNFIIDNDFFNTLTDLLNFLARNAYRFGLAV